MQSKIEIPAELHTFTRTVYGWRGGGTESATSTWYILGF